VLVATVLYDYDNSGRLVKAENADAVVEFEYNDAGQLTAERLNGRETVRESAAGFIQACNYTATGQLANQAAGRNSLFFQ
ncbi:RHS repeat domain-containing protein, partial [Pseudescherichia vulneris]